MIKVNQDAWNGLSQEHRAAIDTMAMASFGTTITADPSTTPPSAGPQAAAFGGPICELLCSIAEQAGKLACQRLPSPAKEICIQVAEKGGAFCKSKCN